MHTISHREQEEAKGTLHTRTGTLGMNYFCFVFTLTAPWNCTPTLKEAIRITKHRQSSQRVLWGSTSVLWIIADFLFHFFFFFAFCLLKNYCENFHICVLISFALSLSLKSKTKRKKDKKKLCSINLQRPAILCNHGFSRVALMPSTCEASLTHWKPRKKTLHNKGKVGGWIMHEGSFILGVMLVNHVGPNQDSQDDFHFN